MKTSKIKEVNDVKEWGDGDRKTHYHNLTMENGDKINIGKKTVQTVGAELTYEITGDEQHEFRKAKSIQKDFTPQSKGYQPDQDAILYSVVLKGVMDYMTTHGQTNFEAPQINELTLSIAKKAKENIQVLKQS